VLTVLKNARTDRTIGAEPGINCFFQLGIGNMIRKRLLDHGIDLRDQRRNGLLAYYGARANNVVTVDFTDASGLICRRLVEEVTPQDWFAAMDAARSRFSRLPSGEWEFNEKFSSMGNGFTFPLQTLIFLSVALVACDEVSCTSEYVSVYGDDVILPRPAYSRFMEICSFLGFKLNADKSFASGYFRESCGEHYFHAVDCKPVYLKARFGDTSDIFKFANSVRRFAYRNQSYGCDKRFRRLWRWLYSCVPSQHVYHVPQGCGDGGFEVDFDFKPPQPKVGAKPTGTARPFAPKRAEGWVEGYWYPAVQAKPVSYIAQHLGVYLARLFNVRDEVSMSELPLEIFPWVPHARHDELSKAFRDLRYAPKIDKANDVGLRRRTKLRVKWQLAPRWESVGPWV